LPEKAGVTANGQVAGSVVALEPKGDTHVVARVVQVAEKST